MEIAKVLLCDSESFDSLDIENYDEIFLMESTLIDFEDNKINKIPLHEYFMRSHKLARGINNALLNNSRSIQNELHLSLLKLADTTLFSNARIIEILSDIYQNNHIDIKTSNSQYLNYFFDILDINYTNVNILDAQKRKFKLSSLKKVIKIFLLMCNSLKVRKKDEENIFFIYNDKISFEFAKPYINSCLTYPFFSPGLSYKIQKYDVKDYLKYKFITPQIFLYGVKNYFINKNAINSSSFPEEIKALYITQLLDLEINSMMILSLKTKFSKLKRIVGLFDTYSPIDYVTYHLNSLYSIDTICIPHGINFRYKVNYISLGTNIYTFWSQDHLDRMNKSSLILESKTKKLITGNIVYKNTRKYLTRNVEKSKNILVVGEYFSKDNYYSSPFNYQATKDFFDTLSEFIARHKDCKVTIRTRLDDEYAKLSQQYIFDNITVSSPNRSMIEEINENDLIISVFSNALHEALLLEKKVLQVNLLKIENYRDLARDKLVYYANTKGDFIMNLESWYNDKLPVIDYQKHLSKYCNNAKFIKQLEGLY